MATEWYSQQKSYDWSSKNSKNTDNIRECWVLNVELLAANACHEEFWNFEFIVVLCHELSWITRELAHEFNIQHSTLNIKKRCHELSWITRELAHEFNI